MAANQVIAGAGGDIIPIPLPRKNGTIICQVKLNGLTGLNLILEVRRTKAFAFTQIKMKDPGADAMISALSTDGQIGWAENIGYSDAQMRQVGATAGAGPADISVGMGDED